MSTTKVELARVGAVASSRPRYQTEGAAGMDLHAALVEPIELGPLQRVVIPTGWAIAIPTGFEGQVRPRSGRALRDGLTVLNAPGTIDADYRGELRVLLVNLGATPIRVAPDDRIAQLVICPVVRAEVIEVASLDVTVRGAGGYGSTG